MDSIFVPDIKILQQDLVKHEYITSYRKFSYMYIVYREQSDIS